MAASRASSSAEPVDTAGAVLADACMPFRYGMGQQKRNSALTLYVAHLGITLAVESR